MYKIKLFLNYFTHKIGKKKNSFIYINFVTYRNRQLVSFTEEVWLNKSTRSPLLSNQFGEKQFIWRHLWGIPAVWSPFLRDQTCMIFRNIISKEHVWVTLATVSSHLETVISHLNLFTNDKWSLSGVIIKEFVCQLWHLYPVVKEFPVMLNYLL